MSIYSTIDLHAPGKQFGHLGVPYSHNLGGRTVLVLGGNHGDEYPGPIAILKLMRRLTPEQVSGRVILIPALTMPAVKSSTRLSPWDGRNMNRSFPGVPGGTMTEQIAHYVSSTLFPMADIVIDIHTGGRSTDFVLCAHMHLVPDRELRRAILRLHAYPQARWLLIAASALRSMGLNPGHLLGMHPHAPTWTGSAASIAGTSTRGKPKAARERPPSSPPPRKRQSALPPAPSSPTIAP